MLEDISSKYIVTKTRRLNWKPMCVFVNVKLTDTSRTASLCLGLLLLPCSIRMCMAGEVIYAKKSTEKLIFNE